MDRTAVMAWVDTYEQAWRAADADALPRLFTEDARYRRSPYSRAMIGYAAMREFWIHFAEDGRADDFEEWAYWPDKPYPANP